MAKCMVTTIDNVYNPFTHFDEWLAYDMSKDYRTNEWLALFSASSSEFNDEESEENSLAIDRLLELNPYGLHIKVYDYEANELIPLANKIYDELYSSSAT